MANYKECNDRLNVVIDSIGPISHHLESIMGIIELIILCAFAYKLDVLMLKLEKLYYTSRRFDLLTSLKNVTN